MLWREGFNVFVIIFVGSVQIRIEKERAKPSLIKIITTFDRAVGTAPARDLRRRFGVVGFAVDNPLALDRH